MGFNEVVNEHVQHDYGTAGWRFLCACTLSQSKSMSLHHTLRYTEFAEQFVALRRLSWCL